MNISSSGLGKIASSTIKSISQQLTEAAVGRNIKRQVERVGTGRLLPRQLAIETAAHCNAKCIMCPYPTLERPKGFMTLELHRLIVDKVAHWGAPISSISHAGMGEPLTDKSLAEKIRYEKSVFRQAKVFVYTNASLLDEKRSGDLFTAGLDWLSISLNAFRKETYEAVMKLPYERTQQNIARFLKTNAEKGKPAKVQVSLIPTERHAPEEIREFQEYWRDKVDGINLPPWMTWGNHFAKPALKKQYPCRYIWEVLQVDWDGTVKICCEDYESRYPRGNLATQSPEEVFNSAIMRQQRADQANGKFEFPEICRNCVETAETARDFWRDANLAVANPAGAV